MTNGTMDVGKIPDKVIHGFRLTPKAMTLNDLEH